MDIIYIEDIETECRIGVLPWEHRIAQKLKLDLEIGIDLSYAGKSDALDDTLDYSAIVNGLKEQAKAQHFELLEALGETLCAWVLQQDKAEWCRIKINKFGAIPKAGNVGIILERSATA